MFLQKSTMNRILAAILMTVAPGEARAQDTIVTVRGYVLDFRAMVGLKSFSAAVVTVSGIELTGEDPEGAVQDWQARVAAKPRCQRSGELRWLRNSG
jgi:hypothetical protein